MIRDARERVTRQLRDKIRHNVADEANELVQRAENLRGTMDGHPRSPELCSGMEALKSAMASGNSVEIEDKTFQLMSLVNELETSGRA